MRIARSSRNKAACVGHRGHQFPPDVIRERCAPDKLDRINNDTAGSRIWHFAILADRLGDFFGQGWVGQTSFQSSRDLGCKKCGSEQGRQSAKYDQPQTKPAYHAKSIWAEFKTDNVPESLTFV